jgi:hypothetical protein
MISKVFRKDREREFWTWFEKNKNIYYHFEDNQEELFDQLRRKLKIIHDDLTFEFSPVHPDGTRELFISADGIKDAFLAVISLVDKAPEINEWRIVAFRQRIPGDDIEINMGGLKIGYSDIYFRYGNDDNKIGIELNIRAYDPADNRYKNAIYVLLDGLIGEYDMETKIGWIQWVTLEGSKIDDLIPLISLREIVDAMGGDENEP